MQPGDIVVVRLSDGLSLRRVVEAKGERVRLAIGRNKEARLSRTRVVLETGVKAEDEDRLDAFRDRCEAMASGVDLSEVWEVTRDDASALSLEDITGLYWTKEPDIAYRIALLLHLDQEDPYFTEESGKYLPRSVTEVEEVMALRRRKAEQEEAFDSLAEHLVSGQVPSDLSRYQSELLDHVRGFVVYGDSYTRAGLVRDLVGRVTPGTQDLQREAFRLMVKAGVMSEDEPLEILRAEVPDEFPKSVIEPAGDLGFNAFPSDGRRRDLTDLLTFTIDHAGTRDRDDAVSLETVNGRCRLGIHITAAGAYIESGGELDREADRRMASLYLPERKIPMLPPVISEEAGSLNPGEIRAALSVLIEITEDGEVLDWEVVPTIVRSDEALSYDQVDGQIASGSGEWHELLTVLDRIAAGRTRIRKQAGALILYRPEMEVTVEASGDIGVKVIDRLAPSRRLVSELMILCNYLLAQFCADNKLPAGYRSQKPLEGASSAQNSDQPYDPVLDFAAMRKMAPAELSSEPGAHSGLGVPVYIQATSPLRRFPDMVMQRQISHFINEGATLYSADAVSSVVARADVQIRELARIEDRRRRYWFLKFLAQTRLARAGTDEGVDLFEAVVLDRRDRGPSLVELREYPFRTRVQLTDRDLPGDVLTLRLHDVDLWTRSGRFIRAP